MDLGKTARRVFMSKTRLFYCLYIFFCIYALRSTIITKTPCLDIRFPLTGKADFNFRVLEETSEKMNNNEDMKRWMTTTSSLAKTRRLLSGLGSSPPRCLSKCGRCTPCKPVHVAVPPGTPVTAEYYPEAWRCKCGNKLYIP